MKHNEKNWFKVIIFIVVLLIPIIYSFFYLKSYWDPYGNLKDMKIAVVNLDSGSDNENQGNEFVKELKDSGTFDICDVSLDEANDGLRDGNYYAMIMIPSDFSSKLNSAKEENKQMATITYTPNKATNYLATQIVGSAIKTIETNLQAKVGSKVVDNLADNLEKVPGSLQDISDGAGQIVDGSQSLSDGLNELNSGVGKLNNSYKEFDEGVSSAYSGSQSLTEGTNQVNDGIETLQSGANELNNGVTQINQALDKADLSKLGELTTGIQTLNDGVNGKEGLNNGVTEYVAGTESLANGVITLNSTLDENIKQYKAIYENPNVEVATKTQAGIALQTLQTIKEKINDSSKGTSLVKGAQMLTAKDSKTGLTSGGKLKYGTSLVSGGVTKLNSATSDIKNLGNSITALKENLAKVQVGTGNLTSGISKLQSGSNQVKTGSESLTNGLSKLNISSKSVKEALNTLSSGTNSAYNGSKDLVEGAQTLKDGVDEGLADTNEELKKLNGLSTFVEDPVEFDEQSYGEINSYGIAFTPLFLCIGLWVGSLMCYVVCYYDQKNRFWLLGSNTRNKLLQNFVYLFIGALEGIITGFLLKAGLGFAIENGAQYYLACTIIGITFMSVVQFLIRNFNDIGKFFALIILVLQLAASGGTFPVETISQGFRSITGFLPMTYTIKLLREILVPTDTNYKGKYYIILIGITVVCVTITCVVDVLRKKKAKKDNKLVHN